MNMFTAHKVALTPVLSLAVLSVAGACQTAPPVKPPVRPASQPAPASQLARTPSCKQRVTALKRWMDTWINLPMTPGSPPGITLIPRPGAARLEGSAVQVAVFADRVTIEGQQVASGAPAPGPIKKMTDLLRKHRQRLERISKLTGGKLDNKLDRVHLLVDARARWGAVAAVAASLQAEKVNRVGLIFDLPDRVRRPGPSRMDRAIERIKGMTQPAQRQVALANVWSDLIRRCPPLREGFSRVSSAAPGKRQSTLGAMIPAALLRCGCSVDMPGLETLLFTTIFNGVPDGVVWLTLDRVGARVQLPAVTPWSEAHRTLLGAVPGQGKAVNLVVQRP